MKQAGYLNREDQGFPHPIYGSTVKIFSSSGITLSETIYPPRLHIPLHAHVDHGYFNLVLQGGHSEHDRNRTHQCQRLTLSFHPPGTTHSDEFYNRLTRLFNIRLDSFLLNRFQERNEVPVRPAYFGGGLPISLALSLYQEFRLAEPISDLAIQELALLLLAQASGSSPESDQPLAMPAWLKRTQDILHSTFDGNVSLSKIADQVGVHRVHLARAFRQRFNCTVSEYRRLLRIELACRRLSASQASLLDITQDCGFSDQPHFSRTFKRYVGLTPLQYRAVFRPLNPNDQPKQARFRDLR